MKDLKRRYVYEETFSEIMAWAKEKGIRSPNRKSNFPFFLQEYLKEKGGVQHVERI
jgi:hypothetical protein